MARLHCPDHILPSADLRRAVPGRRTLRIGTARLLVCAVALLAGAGVGVLAAGMKDPPRGLELGGHRPASAGAPEPQNLP